MFVQASFKKFLGEKEMSGENMIGRLTVCPICKQGNLLEGRGVQVHIIKKHPKEVNKTTWLPKMT